MNKINGWDKDGDMCHICGKKESLTLCEGCNKLSCKTHFAKELCDTCMSKVNDMRNIVAVSEEGHRIIHQRKKSKVGYCSTAISKSVSWIEKEWNKNMLNEDVIKGTIQIAQTMVTYNNALIEEGMDKEDALKMTIAYQGQQIDAVTKAGIEEKKNLMLLAKTTVNN